MIKYCLIFVILAFFGCPFKESLGCDIYNPWPHKSGQVMPKITLNIDLENPTPGCKDGVICRPWKQTDCGKNGYCSPVRNAWNG